MKQETWRWAQRALVSAALLSMLCFFLLEYWFFKTSPSEPGLEAIHQVNWHGTTVYVTDAQQRETDTLFWAGPLLLLIAVGFNLWAEWLREKERFSPEINNDRNGKAKRPVP